MFSANFCLEPAYLCAKKNFILISIGFCVIPLHIYREILKKYRKRAVTLHIFPKSPWNNPGAPIKGAVFSSLAFVLGKMEGINNADLEDLN